MNALSRLRTSGISALRTASLRTVPSTTSSLQRARLAPALSSSRGFAVGGKADAPKPLQFEQVSTADLEGDEEREMMKGLSVAGHDSVAQARTKIELLHRVACRKGIPTYVDPSTHYTVLTSVELSKGGECCGNMCRHCPFSHAAVINQ
mmetsp:Transcript_16004/g.40274  ORF Transcript_16004/g.40274 Transcript_16004/m.40274 type:complete len:149 (+) Transcript_16004:27-473(+)